MFSGSISSVLISPEKCFASNLAVVNSKNSSSPIQVSFSKQLEFWGRKKLGYRFLV